MVSEVIQYPDIQYETATFAQLSLQPTSPERWRLSLYPFVCTMNLLFLLRSYQCLGWNESTAFYNPFIPDRKLANILFRNPPFQPSKYVNGLCNQLFSFTPTNFGEVQGVGIHDRTEHKCFICKYTQWTNEIKHQIEYQI